MLTKKENKKLVTINNVNKQYGHKIVVENFNLDIDAGERIAIIGSNGRH